MYPHRRDVPMKRETLYLMLLCAGVLILIGFLVVEAAEAQAFADPEQESCLDNIGTLTLIVELTQRGITRFGCNSDAQITASWTPNPDLDLPDPQWYEIEVKGEGPSGTVTVTRTLIPAEVNEISFWAFEWVTILVGRARAWNEHGPSEWGEWGEVHIVER